MPAVRARVPLEGQPPAAHEAGVRQGPAAAVPRLHLPLQAQERPAPPPAAAAPPAVRPRVICVRLQPWTGPH